MSIVPQEETVPEVTRGWRLRLSLDHAEMEAQEMADHLSVAPSTISRWTREDDLHINPLFLREWARLCRVPYEWLAFGSEPAPKGSGGAVTLRGRTPRSRNGNRSYPWDEIPLGRAA